MKKPIALFSLCSLLLAGAFAAQAGSIQGAVFCDADGTGQVSAGDAPLAGVKIIVTNVSGTFVAEAVTGTDGVFSLALPDVIDAYVQFLDPATLPAESVVAVPANGIFYFSISLDSQSFTSGYLVTSPFCPPGPPVDPCWAKASGSVRSSRGTTEHSFGGTILPDCPGAPGASTWSHTARIQRLQFKSVAIRPVRCGFVAGGLSYLEFTGAGVVKSSSKAAPVEVRFYARLEDRTLAGDRDNYYFRAFTPTGETLILVSGDPENPDNVVPVPMSVGKATIRISTCDDPPQL